MTNEEAIKILQNDGCCQDCTFGGYPCKLVGCETHQAIDLAIKALEDKPQGEWVVQRLQNGFDDVYCPFCNARPTKSEYGYYLKDNFCHECGADMRKGDTK